MSNDERDKNSPESGPPSEGSKSGPGLLEKIKSTLANTPADRWEQGGEELDTSKRYQRSRETWEQLFCTDTKTGVLVLRCSTAVVSNFFAGGFSFTESVIPRYSVELRPRGWTPKMHGLGNDYVYIEDRARGGLDLSRAARLVSDRHFAVGGDGLIAVCPPSSHDADLRHSVAAIQRAALRARETARQTGTCLVVSRNGVVELLEPSAPELQGLSIQQPLSPYVVTPRSE